MTDHGMNLQAAQFKVDHLAIWCPDERCTWHWGINGFSLGKITQVAREHLSGPIYTGEDEE